MPRVLAIEPDHRQGAILKRIVRDRVQAELVLVDSRDAAIAAISASIPDVILVTALFSPRDEEELIARLRALEGAGHLQLHTIPQLAASREDADGAGGGLFGKLKKKKDAPMLGCDPDMFADEIKTFIDTAEQQKAMAVHRRKMFGDSRPSAAASGFSAADAGFRTEAPTADRQAESAALDEGVVGGSASDSAWASPFEWRKKDSRPSAPRPAEPPPLVTNVPLAVVADEEDERRRDEDRKRKEAAARAAEEERARQEAEARAQEQRTREETAARAAEEERRRKEAEARAAAEEERRRKEAAARAAEEERKRKEAAARAAEEEERKRREAAARAAEEERKRKEAAARAAEEERKRREAAARAAEEERKRREEEERLRREAAARAAEEERKRKEAEARAAEAERRRREAEARAAEEERRRKEAEARAAEEERARREAAARAEAERQRREAEARAAEEERRRKEAEARAVEAERKRKEAEARAAEEERKRKEAAARAEEEERKRREAARAEEERRRREEERRRQEAAAREAERLRKEAEAAAARRREEDEKIARKGTRKPKAAPTAGQPTLVATASRIVPSQFAEFSEEHEKLQAGILGLDRLDAWARTERRPSEEDREAIEKNELFDLFSGLAIPAHVASVGYVGGCRIRRVRVPPDPSSKPAAGKKGQPVILSRRALDDMRSGG